MNSLMIMGMLSLLQVCVLPGLLVLKVCRVPRDSLIQAVVYCFGFSLLFNYCLVFALTAAGLYVRAAVLLIFALEVAAVVAAYRADLGSSIGAWVRRAQGWIQEACARLHAGLVRDAGVDAAFWLGRLLLLVVSIVLAVDSFVWLTKVFRYNLGDIFREWDAVTNWNVWATMWFRGVIPNSSQYPHLVTTNWSLTYMFMGSPDVQFFATGIMPLFAILCLLLFVDLALSFRSIGFLLALVATRFMMKKFAGAIDDGYMDVAVMFFFFLPVHALLKGCECGDRECRRRYGIAGAYLAAGAAVAKPSGLYILAIWPILCLFVLDGGQGDGFWPKARRTALDCAGPVIIAASWYVLSLVMVQRGENLALYEALPENALYARPVATRVAAAIAGLGKYNLLFVASLLTLPVVDRKYRWLTLGIAIPYALIWAGFLSYDTRNVAPVIPVISTTAAIGVDNLLLRMESTARRLRLSSLRVGVLVVVIVGALLVGGVLVRDEVLLRRQETLQRELWYPQLNERIYQRAAEAPGAIFLTNYRMDFLPGLADVTLLDHLADYETFASLLQQHPEIGTILYSHGVNDDIKAQIGQGLESGRYSLVAEMGDWVMVGVNEIP